MLAESATATKAAAVTIHINIVPSLFFDHHFRGSSPSSFSFFFSAAAALSSSYSSSDADVRTKMAFWTRRRVGSGLRGDEDGGGGCARVLANEPTACECVALDIPKFGTGMWLHDFK